MKLITITLILISINVYSQFNKNIYLFEKNGKMGYVSNAFKIRAKPIYDGLGGLHEQYWGAYSTFSLNKMYGVLNIKGKQIISPKYEYLEYIYIPNSKIFKFRINEKYGLVNNKGKEILKPNYDYSIEVIDKGRAFIVQQTDGKYVILDKKGHSLTKKQYDYLSGNYDSDFCTYKENNKYGYLNSKGEEVLPPTFSYAHNFIGDHAIVKIHDKYAIINKTDVLLVEPIYDAINYQTSFCHDQELNKKANVYYVKSNHKTGLLDEYLKILTKPIYDEIGDFSEGFAFVVIDKKYGFINTKGELVIPLMYENADSFSEGIAPVLKSAKWGYINSQNNVVIDFKFSGCVRPFFGGLAVYHKRPSNSNKGHYIEDECGYIDLKGNVQIETIFRNAYRFVNGVALVDDNSFIYLINKEGEKLLLKKSEEVIIEIGTF